MKSLKLGNVVLCDYVARGHANKFNLVNAISGDITIAGTPADVNFGLYLELFAPDNPLGNFKLEVLFDGQIIFAAEGEGSTQSGGQAGVIAVPLFPIKVQNNGILEVYVSSAGLKRTRALQKRIAIGVMPASAF